jgi:hypothetical protein
MFRVAIKAVDGRKGIDLASLLYNDDNPARTPGGQVSNVWQ